VVLAILEKCGVMSPIFMLDGEMQVGVGTVSAGWQNFFICLEMFLAAVALRFAFPHSVYRSVALFIFPSQRLQVSCFVYFSHSLFAGRFGCVCVCVHACVCVFLYFFFFNLSVSRCDVMSTANGCGCSLLVSAPGRHAGDPGSILSTDSL
jgi:hypothetical protein